MGLFCIRLRTLVQSNPSNKASNCERVMDTVSDLAPDAAAPARKKPARRSNLPVVVPEKPKAPAQIQPENDATLTPDQAIQAFARIQQGEKILDVARDFGVSMGHLRSRWALHKRYLQQHIAEGGHLTHWIHVVNPPHRYVQQRRVVADFRHHRRGNICRTFCLEMIGFLDQTFPSGPIDGGQGVDAEECRY